VLSGHVGWVIVVKTPNRRAAMMSITRRLTPLPASIVVELRRNLVEYWNAVALCDELGGVLGSLVREVEVKVTELLESGDSWDVYEANRITAEFDYTRRLHS
jgi:hypothetical protein